MNQTESSERRIQFFLFSRAGTELDEVISEAKAQVLGLGNIVLGTGWLKAVTVRRKE